jgi:hypothetical protein
MSRVHRVFDKELTRREALHVFEVLKRELPRSS